MQTQFMLLFTITQNQDKITVYYGVDSVCYRDYRPIFELLADDLLYDSIRSRVD